MRFSFRSFVFWFTAFAIAASGIAHADPDSLILLQGHSEDDRGFGRKAPRVAEGTDKLFGAALGYTWKPGVPLRKAEGEKKPSLEAGVETALAKLVDTEDPGIVLYIASHGMPGAVCPDGKGTDGEFLPHELVVQAVFDPVKRFLAEREKKKMAKPLRVRVIADCCYADSLRGPMETYTRGMKIQLQGIYACEKDKPSYGNALLDMLFAVRESDDKPIDFTPEQLATLRALTYRTSLDPLDYGGKDVPTVQVSPDLPSHDPAVVHRFLKDRLRTVAEDKTPNADTAQRWISAATRLPTWSSDIAHQVLAIARREPTAVSVALEYFRAHGAAFQKELEAYAAKLPFPKDLPWLAAICASAKPKPGPTVFRALEKAFAAGDFKKWDGADPFALASCWWKGDDAGKITTAWITDADKTRQVMARFLFAEAPDTVVSAHADALYRMCEADVADVADANHTRLADCFQYYARLDPARDPFRADAKRAAAKRAQDLLDHVAAGDEMDRLNEQTLTTALRALAHQGKPADLEATLRKLETYRGAGADAIHWYAESFRAEREKKPLSLPRIDQALKSDIPEVHRAALAQLVARTRVKNRAAAEHLKTYLDRNADKLTDDDIRVLTALRPPLVEAKRALVACVQKKDSAADIAPGDDPLTGGSGGAIPSKEPFDRVGACLANIAMLLPQYRAEELDPLRDLLMQGHLLSSANTEFLTFFILKKASPLKTPHIDWLAQAADGKTIEGLPEGWEFAQNTPRVNAMHLLALHGDAAAAKAIPIFERALKSPDAEERLHARDALTLLWDRSENARERNAYIQKLAGLVADKKASPQDRFAAAAALGSMERHAADVKKALEGLKGKQEFAIINDRIEQSLAELGEATTK